MIEDTKNYHMTHEIVASYMSWSGEPYPIYACMGCGKTNGAPGLDIDDSALKGECTRQRRLEFIFENAVGAKAFGFTRFAREGWHWLQVNDVVKMRDACNEFLGSLGGSRIGTKARGYAKNRPFNSSDEEKMAVYKIARTDQEAADMLGLKKSTFTNWRFRMDLPPMAKRGRPAKEASE